MGVLRTKKEYVGKLDKRCYDSEKVVGLYAESRSLRRLLKLEGVDVPDWTETSQEEKK